VDGNTISKGGLDTLETSGVKGVHNTNFNTKDTGLHHYMSNSRSNIVLSGLTSLDHVSLLEFLGLGSLASELTRDGNLGTLGTGLHDVSKDGTRGTTGGEEQQHLGLEGLALDLCGQALLFVADLHAVKLDVVQLKSVHHLFILERRGEKEKKDVNNESGRLVHCIFIISEKMD
jgi:hypothetical protein